MDPKRIKENCFPPLQFLKFWLYLPGIIQIVKFEFLLTKLKNIDHFLIDTHFRESFLGALLSD